MDDYETPKWLLEIAFPDGKYFDPCPLGAKQAGRDGLKEEWPTDIPVFINPPYSNPYPWVERAANHKGPTHLLLPVDATTSWWVFSSHFKITLITQRLKFIRWTNNGQVTLDGRPFKTESTFGPGSPGRAVGQSGGPTTTSWWYHP